MRPETGLGYPLNLHYFPWPYPDEVIGSLLVRACRHWGMSIKQFNRDVLGVVNSHMPMLMSAHLPRLAELTGLSPNALLDQHTVFPYITAFLPAEQTSQFRRRLLTMTADGLKPLASLIHGATVGGLGWRFCPKCSEVDRHRFGESYWHRSHLLPGVLICHSHGQMLFEISSTSDDRLALPHDSSSQPLVPLMTHEKLVKVAVASAGRLGDNHGNFNQIPYRRLADEAGYRVNKREIAGLQLSHDLEQYYGKPFLARFGCSFTPSPVKQWPGLLIHPSLNGSFAPIKHVLLRVYLEQAPKVAKEICRKPPGKVPRDYGYLDIKVTTSLAKAIVELARQGKTINAWDLLKKIGVWHIYRHNRQVMPMTTVAIENFRRSPQCRKQIRR